ncbi:MAG: glycosyltransferase family 4 protein, partial [Firmicutes bacterium]|nr:glycosyltransferase family 4 protein [Bacillota bacterium]
MQILFPMHSLERGGGCRVVAEAANGLVARGHRVFLALPEGAPLSWYVTAEVVRVPRLAPQFMPAADLTIPTFYTTVPVAVALRRPFIRLSLGFEPLWVPDPGTALATYRWPRPIITISTWLQEIILHRTGRTSHLVHPGVDRAVFYPRGNKGAYGRPSVVFLLRGPGYAWKGADVLWQAMTMVLARRPDVKLLLIANYEAGDPGLNLPYLLLRAPSDEELARIISAGDVFVFPSLFEGFGLPPLEAMACGTAVVTTTNGGMRDYAQHG